MIRKEMDDTEQIVNDKQNTTTQNAFPTISEITSSFMRKSNFKLKL